MLTRGLAILALVFALVPPASAQPVEWAHGETLPPTCVPVGIFVKTAAPAGVYVCAAVDTWAELSSGEGGGVPAGASILIDSGTCPTGYEENTALNGKTLIGTLAANKNVGTTVGSDTITPAGVNSVPTFAGNAWSAPT